MNRVPYRRVTPPRDGVSTQIEFKHRQENKTTIGETIIVQAIISGLLLAVVLVICLVDIAPLVSLRGRLGQALNGATTVEEFAADINHFRENWLGAAQTPQYEQPEHIPQFEYTPQPEQMPQLEHPQFEPYVQPEPEEPIPLTAQEEPINPQIPGPSMGPGLWD